jgi:aryl-alcohol dehydrogenase-like predicted oxidoreductase
MEYCTLGRTGLKASVAGIGTGGPSRVGQQQGKSDDESVEVIRSGLEAGVNFVDTAEAYGTEEIVGTAIQPFPRESLILSTKLSRWEDIGEDGVAAKVDESLKKLGTDYIDVYHLHAVTAELYPMVCDSLVPQLLRQREAGKIRFLGITERFNADPGHMMLDLALEDDVWDVVMVGFNILNQSARARVFPRTIEKNIGVLDMFAVRLALSRKDRLREVVSDLVGRGAITGVDPEEPLGFIASAATSTVDAAYRFVRHEPGVHVTLTGTGSTEHLRENLISIQKPPLPQDVHGELIRAFAGVDSISGQ